jgi:hypothetical protein
MNQLFTITLIMAIIVSVFAGVVLLQLIITIKNFHMEARSISINRRRASI